MPGNLWDMAGGLWRALSRRYKRFNSWYKALYAGKPWYVKSFYALCTLALTLVLCVVAVFTNFLWLFGQSPSLGEIMEPRPYNASYVYSCDGKQIGKLFKENRTPVQYGEVDSLFFKILIDTEDERFYGHHGIDFHGMGGAAKDFIVKHRGRGASTITQQLVKNMFRMRTRKYTGGLLCYIPGVKMLIMKAKEWILASLIEVKYDKEDILMMYANTVDFGNQAFGIKTAAKTYFDTTPAKLKPEQSAMLVGILKGTSVYNPLKHPKRCLERRNVVLGNALAHGDITQEQHDRLCRKELDLKYTPETELNNECPYFLNAMVEQMRDWCEDNDVDFYRDGLEIHTTIDSRMQRCAEQAVRQHMRTVQQSFDREWGQRDCWVDAKGKPVDGFLQDKIEKSEIYKLLMARYNENLDSVERHMNLPHRVRLFDYNGGHEATMSSVDSIRYMLHKMHCGFIAMDPLSGEVKAWVGDVDYGTWQYDNVRAQHQPGSTFKLFVYSAAVSKRGLRPCDQFEDSPIAPLADTDPVTGRPTTWQPTNASGRFTNQLMTLRAAMARSNNIIAVKVGQETGIGRVAQTARDMGITSALTETPSLFLGASDVSLVDLVASYGTVVNDGQPKQPKLVTRIYRTGPAGIKEEIYNSAVITDPDRALSHRDAYTVRRMLEAVCSDAGGTGLAINNYLPGDIGIGGKTGTSNNYADGWFVAITPKLVCGAWVGGQYRQIHFRSAQGQGSRAALPMVGLFLQKVLNNRSFAYLRRQFPPDHDLDRSINACGNSQLVDATTGDSLGTGAYQPYNDSIMPQNSADGSYDSTYYIRSRVNDDINGGSAPAGNAETPEQQPAVSPEIDERVRNAFN